MSAWVMPCPPITPPPDILAGRRCLKRGLELEGRWRSCLTLDSPRIRWFWLFLVGFQALSALEPSL